MDLTKDSASADKFAFSSSVAADVWHPQKDAKAYEWWYFDALSDDGSEAIVIVFLDNFIYSPRYNDARIRGAKFPAISFTYFRDGQAVYRAVNEFTEDEFSASREMPECTIGPCSFRFETAAYGSGYVVNVSIALSGERKLEGRFEWLAIESDFSPETFTYRDTAHSFNMAVPRADVTGRIEIKNRRGETIEERPFRGTGYHDHNLDNRWLAKTVRDWHWGRAHFADATAVFYRYCEVDDHTPVTKMFIVRRGEFREREVQYEEQNYVRDKFGIKYPTRLRLISEDNMRLRVKPIKVIDSSFYYLRFLSEITLTLRDGIPRKTRGITEFLAPKTLKYRWLNWISDMRTGKRGKGPLLP